MNSRDDIFVRNFLLNIIRYTFFDKKLFFVELVVLNNLIDYFLYRIIRSNNILCDKTF